MRHATLLFQHDDLAHLYDLHQSRWDHYGAEAMTDNGHCALQSAYLRTSAGAVTIAADIVMLDIEGDPEEYSRLQINAGAYGESTARRSGQVFFQHKGQTVTDILVVRDAIRRTEPAEEGFELISDSGIVILLDGGFIAFCKSNAYMLDMDMAIARDTFFAPELLPDPTLGWDSDLHTRYEVARRIIPLYDLLDRDC